MKAYQTLLFLCSVLLLVVGLCLIFPEEGVTIGNGSYNPIRDDDSTSWSLTLRFPTLEQALTKSHTDKESAEEKLRKAEEEVKIQFERDSIAQEEARMLAEHLAAEEADSLTFQDTLKNYQKFFAESSARIYCADDDPSGLFDLFDQLDNCSKGKGAVHILHYGDSQIEQDRITAYVREELQKKFGGWGPGLVPAIQPIPSISVGQTSSDTIRRWLVDGSLEQRMNHDRYGVLGQMAEVKGYVKLGLAARNWKKTFAHVKKFSRVKFMVGNTGENFSVTLSYNGKDTTQVITDANAYMTTLTWQLNEQINSFDLKVKGTGELYAISMESPTGVYVDNIPLRGSSGTYFTRINSSLMKSSMKELNVRLILLEFGGNATPHMYNGEFISKYRASLDRQIAFLKRSCPNAQILFIGPADMSVMRKGELQTYPLLPTVIDSLKDVSLQNKAMFWDMYEVMGGENSMIKWVEHDPAWAAPDYIHFTESGTKKIADVFVQSFMNYYDYYCFLKRHSKWSHIED